MPKEPLCPAVIFDLDGTLVDSRHAIVDAVIAGIEDVGRRLGLSTSSTRREQLEQALGLPSDEYFRAVVPTTLQQHRKAVKAAATLREVEALREGQARLFPHALASLDALREQGLQVAIVSNAQREYFRAALEYLGLGARAHYSECQEELPASATPPFKTALVRRALHGMRAEPQRSYVVGDRGEDLDAGRACGCRAVAIEHGFGAESEFAGADHRVADLPELVELVRVG